MRLRLQTVLATFVVATALSSLAIGTASAKSQFYNPDDPLIRSKQKYLKRKEILNKGIEAHNRALTHHEKMLNAKRTFMDERERYYKSIIAKYIYSTTKTEEQKYLQQLKKLDEWWHPKFNASTRDQLAKRETNARQEVERLASEFRGRFASFSEQLKVYTNLFVDRGPRYLKQVTIKLNDEVHYLGRYDPVPDPVNNPEFNIREMRAELGRIYATI